MSKIRFENLLKMPKTLLNVTFSGFITLFVIGLCFDALQTRPSLRQLRCQRPPSFQQNSVRACAILRNFGNSGNPGFASSATGSANPALPSTEGAQPCASSFEEAVTAVTDRGKCRRHGFFIKIHRLALLRVYHPSLLTAWLLAANSQLRPTYAHRYAFTKTGRKHIINQLKENKMKRHVI